MGDAENLRCFSRKIPGQKRYICEFYAEVDMAVVKDLWIWWTTSTRMLLKYFKQSLFLIEFYNERFIQNFRCLVF